MTDPMKLADELEAFAKYCIKRGYFNGPLLADATAYIRASALPQAARTVTRDRVREAMTDAWNTICSDTGCHPNDIQHQGKKLFYTAGHWADLVALFLDADDESGWQPILTAPRDGTHITVGTFPTPPGHISTTTAHWFDGAWALSVNYDGAHSDCGVTDPTHWRPLAAPPALSQQGDNRSAPEGKS